MSDIGRHGAALEEALKAQQLDPLSPQIATFVGIAFDHLHEYEQAEKMYSRALELDSSFLPAVSHLVQTYWREGKLKEAQSQTEVAFALSQNGYAYKLSVAVNLALQKDVAGARRALKEADALPHLAYQFEFLRVLCHIAMGELDKAVELVEQEHRRGAHWLDSLAGDPLYAPIRTSPRVVSILKEIGVTQ